MSKLEELPRAILTSLHFLQSSGWGLKGSSEVIEIEWDSKALRLIETTSFSRFLYQGVLNRW
jgi:hypothetical protein